MREPHPSTAKASREGRTVVVDEPDLDSVGFAVVALLLASAEADWFVFGAILCFVRVLEVPL